jgi:MFS family permease
MVRGFVVLVVAMVGGGLIYQATQTALPKFFEERMGALVGDGTFGIGVMVAIVYGISGLVQVLGGHFADRYPLKVVYLTAYLLQVPLLALASGIAGVPLLLVAVLMTTMNAASFPAENLLLTRFSPERHRSLVFGVRYVIAFGLAPVALLLVSAINAASGGFAWLFLLLAALAGLVVAAGLMLPNPRAPREPAEGPALAE